MPTGLTVVVDRPALIALGTSPTGPIYRFWVKMLAAIDSRAKLKLSGSVVKVNTGNLRSSQQVPFITIAGTKIIGTAQNKASYAAAVHNGTRPHDIRPRRVSVLTGWNFGGSPVFTPLVHHPGTKPRPWLVQSTAEVLSTLHSIT